MLLYNIPKEALDNLTSDEMNFAVMTITLNSNFHEHSYSYDLFLLTSWIELKN